MEKGTKVQFKFTAENGEVVGTIEDGLIQVRLDSDPSMLIPAFEEDLIILKEEDPQEKAIEARKAQIKEEVNKHAIRISTPIPDPVGVQLVFEPLPTQSEEDLGSFRVWLLNDTSYEYIFFVGLYVGDDKLFEEEGKLTSLTASEMGTMLADDLNDHPDIEFELQRISTAGLEEPVNSTIRIKPKSFFGKRRRVDILNTEANAYTLLAPPSEKNQDEPDLKEYTKQKVRKPGNPGTPGPNSIPYKAYDIEEFSTFEPEIDLHIQALMPGGNRLDKSEILRVQLDHCSRFLDRAVRLGAHTVYLIHGVGEGKLKDAIADHLRDRPDVVKFNNQYHHKYGYGATEVLLK